MATSFRLTRIGPTEYGVDTFTTDGSLYTVTTAAVTEVSRVTTDPDRDSIMKVRGRIIDLADNLTLASGYYLNDSIDGMGEGSYKDFVVVGNVQYSFSCLYKVEVGTLVITLYDQTNSAVISTVSVTDTVWSTYDTNITIPETCTTLRIKFLQSNSAHSSPYLIDNVAINGNIFLSNPDTYSRIPIRVGSTQQTLSGRRIYDLFAIHYDFNLGFNYVDDTQFEALREIYYTNEMLFFDDGDVPELTETETIYDNDLYNYVGIANPSTTHIANTDSSASLPSAETDFQTAEYSTGNYQAVDGDDANYAETSNPTAGFYLYHKFRIKSAILAASVQRLRVLVKASCNDASAYDVDGAILYGWNGSQWVELTRSTSDAKTSLSYSTSEPLIASPFVHVVGADSYVQLLLRSRSFRQGASALTLRTYYVDVEINEGMDETIDLSHKAILTNGAVELVYNTTDGVELVLTTNYTVSNDRRSITVLNQTPGDVISVTYRRYFEVFLKTFPENWLAGDLTSINRQVSLVLSTLSESK